SVEAIQRGPPCAAEPGKNSFSPSERRVEPRDLSCAAGGRSRGIGGAPADRATSSKRRCFVPPLPGQKFLARGLGSSLSAPRALAINNGGLSRESGRGGVRNGDLVCAPRSFFGGGVVLVRGNARAGHRFGAGRRPINGRPLHLSAADWGVHHF